MILGARDSKPSRASEVDPQRQLPPRTKAMTDSFQQDTDEEVAENP